MSEQLSLDGMHEFTTPPAITFIYMASYQELSTCALALARWCNENPKARIIKVEIEPSPEGWTVHVHFQ